MSYSIRQKAGALVRDVPRFAWSMRPSPRHSWVRMRNRDERLVSSADGAGVECDWQWTSDLHVAKVFPSLGRRLMKRALGDWPVELASGPVEPGEHARLTFVIGHRGLDRLPHLLLTLASIAAQRGAAVECIVVEQSVAPHVKDHLPSWVRYVHTAPPREDAPYSRSWAFNVGAREARGEIVVLHDGDMLVPRQYAAEILARSAQGYDVVNLKRFVFFLTEAHSKKLFSRAGKLADHAPDSVMQNALGGSVAVARDAYFEIGGFDESFTGWGGEDNEFWERAKTRRVWPFGYLPLVHLWHPMQAGKFDHERATARLFESRSAIPAELRIRELTAREHGKLAAG